MVNTIKRLDFINKTNPNAIAYTEIFQGTHVSNPDSVQYLVFSKLRVTTKTKGITQTATTDTVQNFDDLPSALACMEKWRISRQQNGTWESIVTIDKSEAIK